MSDEDPLPTGSNDQLREEAASWFARMRGPDADVHRQQFEAWLALGAFHRTAYNRIAEIWSLGRNLEFDQRSDPRSTETTMVKHRLGPRQALVGGIALALAVAGMFGFYIATGRDEAAGLPGQTALSNEAMTSARVPRMIKLDDGSSLILDAGAVVARAYNGTVRYMRLEHGRARFQVARDSRPFLLEAGSGSITAAGTNFDVELASNRAVQVYLIDGVLDVAIASSQRHRPGRYRLTQAGQTLTYDRIGSKPAQRVGPTRADWPDGRVEFVDVPLLMVLQVAKRSATRQIEIASTDLGTIHISGVFRIDDPNDLAKKLALLLDLDVSAAPGAPITLSHKRDSRPLRMR